MLNGAGFGLKSGDSVAKRGFSVAERAPLARGRKMAAEGGGPEPRRIRLQNRLFWGCLKKILLFYLNFNDCFKDLAANGIFCPLSRGSG